MKTDNVINVSSESQQGKRKAIQPQVGEVWVVNGPGERWVVTRVYERRIKNTDRTQKSTQARVMLCLENKTKNARKTTRNIAVSTLKTGMMREDKYNEFTKKTRAHLHGYLRSEGASDSDIARANNFFGLDERTPELPKLKSVK